MKSNLIPKYFTRNFLSLYGHQDNFFTQENYL